MVTARSIPQEQRLWWFSPSPSIPSHLLHVGKILFYPSWSVTNRHPHQMWDADGFGVPMGCLMSVDIPEATENSLSPIKTSPHILVAASLSFPLESLLENIPSNHPAQVQTPPHLHPLPIFHPSSQKAGKMLGTRMWPSPPHISSFLGSVSTPRISGFPFPLPNWIYP